MASKGLSSKRQTVGIRITYEYMYIYLCMAGWISKMKLDFQWYEDQHHESILKSQKHCFPKPQWCRNTTSYPWAIHETSWYTLYESYARNKRKNMARKQRKANLSPKGESMRIIKWREVWGHSKWRSCDNAIFGLHPLLLFLIFLIITYIIYIIYYILYIYTYANNCIYIYMYIYIYHVLSHS